MSGFTAKLQELNSSDYLLQTFRLECSGDPQAAVEHLCQEQSTAQWARVGVTEDTRPKHASKLVSLKVVSESDLPAYESPFFTAKKYLTLEAVIAHPVINFGARIPNLMTVVCGEGAFHAAGITCSRLIDLEFPESYLAQFEGPQWGAAGLREILNVFHRPVFFGVVKPNIGLSPQEFAKQTALYWQGGVDLPKDDEMLADAPYCSLKDRLQALQKERLPLEKTLGRKLHYLANITDEVENMPQLLQIAHEYGASAVMLNTLCTGLSAVRQLARKKMLPIVSHFDFMATFTRTPFLGVAPKVVVLLQRLSGCDSIIFPGIAPRMQTSKEDLQAMVHACLKPLGNIKPALPAPGASAEDLGALLEIIGHENFGIVPGRGISKHPEGPIAGGQLLHKTWKGLS